MDPAANSDLPGADVHRDRRGQRQLSQHQAGESGDRNGHYFGNYRPADADTDSAQRIAAGARSGQAGRRQSAGSGWTGLCRHLAPGFPHGGAAGDRPARSCPGECAKRGQGAGQRAHTDSGNHGRLSRPGSRGEVRQHARRRVYFAESGSAREVHRANQPMAHAADRGDARQAAALGRCAAGLRPRVRTEFYARARQRLGRRIGTAAAESLRCQGGAHGQTVPLRNGAGQPSGRPSRGTEPRCTQQRIAARLSGQAHRIEAADRRTGRDLHARTS